MMSRSEHAHCCPLKHLKHLKHLKQQQLHRFSLVNAAAAAFQSTSTQTSLSARGCGLSGVSIPEYRRSSVSTVTAFQRSVGTGSVQCDFPKPPGDFFWSKATSDKSSAFLCCFRASDLKAGTVLQFLSEQQVAL